MRARVHFSYLHPRFADSPGASDLSPAMRARVHSRVFTPGSQTHRGLAICRPLCGLVSILVSSPRFADSPGASDLSPRYAGSCPFSYLHPRFADSPGASDLSPAMRARVDSRIFTPGSQTHGASDLSPYAGFSAGGLGPRSFAIRSIARM